MTAYYNEIEPYCVEWLRNLIAEGLIAPGDVDDRSITDVKPAELRGYTQCHFFAGIGGWSYALRLAGYSDDRPVWTGSCPCQPFSNAGKRAGFADDRHLWPVWQKLIAECRPAVVFGEQVASATQWLGLVRSDLEAMEYAVGAMPVQAASAGADHLRDRYWFVADASSSGRCHGQEEGQGQQSWGTEVVRTSDVAMVDSASVAVGGLCSASGVADTSELFGDGRKYNRSGSDQPEAFSELGNCGGKSRVADSDIAGPQGRELLSECADQRVVGAGSVADADLLSASQGREQRGGQQRGAGGDTEACDGNLADPDINGAHQGRRNVWEMLSAPEGESEPEYGSAIPRRDSHGSLGHESSDCTWLIGADGKARRVKPGIRLLANGVPSRVAKLRAFGNAIDPRPAAQFIGAYSDCCK